MPMYTPTEVQENWTFQSKDKGGKSITKKKKV